MSVILGVNHQFLYPEAITNAVAHTATLKRLAANPLVDAVDCWIWRGESSAEEIKILKDSGKVINYNVGDRFGEEQSFPASPEKAERERAYSLLMREVGYALEVGSKKIIFALGPDLPTDREAAKERVLELTLRVGAQLPDDVHLSLEPTDRDIDKKFLFGPVSETVEFIGRVKQNGFERIGLLLDMCHVPIMHETLESALEKSKGVLNHVHLGNGVMKTDSPFYGDKHTAWNHPDGLYTEADGGRFIHMLKEIGYLDRADATVSFEMRPYEGKSAEESLARFFAVWRSAFES